MSSATHTAEIRTRSVEQVLEPLLVKISTLVSKTTEVERPKGFSRDGDEIQSLYDSVSLNSAECSEE